MADETRTSTRASSRGRRGLLTAAASAAVLAGGLVAATADPAEAVPSCVRTALNDSGFVDYLTVTNSCSRSLRIKVVLANHTDLACRTIPAHTARAYSWSWPGRFDGLRDC